MGRPSPRLLPAAPPHAGLCASAPWRRVLAATVVRLPSRFGRGGRAPSLLFLTASRPGTAPSRGHARPGPVWTWRVAAARPPPCSSRRPPLVRAPGPRLVRAPRAAARRRWGVGADDFFFFFSCVLLLCFVVMSSSWWSRCFVFFFFFFFPCFVFFFTLAPAASAAASVFEYGVMIRQRPPLAPPPFASCIPLA